MLRSVMESANLIVYAEIGLAMFFVTFVGIVVQAIRKPKAEVERLSRMAMEEND